MNAGQKQFYDYIIERTQPEKLSDMKNLLEEGFLKQENGTFTSEYIAEYSSKMLSFLLHEYVDEVRALTDNIGKYKS